MKLHHPIRIGIAAFAVSAALAAASVLPAMAAASPSPSATSGDKATLLSQLSADASGLQTLLGTIDADTTVAKALADTETIVTGYRVFLLEQPKVHLVIAADTETTIESNLQSKL